MSTPTGVEAFEKVKALLLGETTRRLEETVERLARVDARVGDETGDALVGALKRAEENRPRELSGALAPSVVSIVRAEIRNSKDMMVEALYPIMGRLVTAAVAGAFRDLVEGLNARIDALVSANSWRLRFRAIVTGRSMAEIALAEAEAGRLKRALLLERGSGRLLALWPAEAPGREGAMNADLESGMIAAITEFATSVYADKGGELRMLDVGAGKVFLRASPQVIVAGEFGGELPHSRESRLDEAFLAIVERHEAEEDAFTSETLGQLLGDALADPPAKPKSLTPVLLFGAATAALVAWLSYEPALNAWRGRRAAAAFEAAMAAHPELASFPLHIALDHAGHVVALRGLAPDGRGPEAIAIAMEPLVRPYRVSREVQIVAPTADLDAMRGRMDTLREELDTTRAALATAREEAAQLKAAQETPEAKLRRFVESFAIFFNESDMIVDPAGAARGLDELAALVKAFGGGLRVVGYADDVGGAAANRSISRRRADKIIALLVERGLPRARLALVARSKIGRAHV
jgi:outer membrane protein OmpA-like peptidoglycan-associated protein